MKDMLDVALDSSSEALESSCEALDSSSEALDSRIPKEPEAPRVAHSSRTFGTVLPKRRECCPIPRSPHWTLQRRWSSITPRWLVGVGRLRRNGINGVSE